MFIIEFDDISSIKIKYETNNNGLPELYFPIIYENEDLFWKCHGLHISIMIYLIVITSIICHWLKWKYLNRQSIGVPYKEEVTFNLNEEFKNKLLYGVEIFDKDDEDRVYYLEWDIKEQETKGEIFKNHLLGLEGNVNPQSFLIMKI